MKKLTYEQIVDKCRLVHGDTYIYPQNMLERREANRVPIICPKHGEFWQILSNHYKGCGCPKCGGNHKLTTSEYKITLQKKIKNNKIAFDKVVYVNNHTPITLTCGEHGDFTIIPSSIKENEVCPLCIKAATKEKLCHTTEWFINEARLKHGDRYDYSKTRYINAKTKVCIIDSVYGEFWQLPRLHLNGRGCPFKSNNSFNEKIALKTKSFIEKAKKIHGDKYDYSKVEYINPQNKIAIICPIHGEFKQLPYSHLSGCGCRKCGKEILRNKFQLTNSVFVERAKVIHGNKYDYSNVRYINNSTKVKIICPKHGEFLQTPSCHLKGSGCPTCKGELSVSKEEMELELFIQEIYDGLVVFNDRQQINPMELDVFLPFENIAIEFDGLYWHNSSKIGEHYHVKKTEQCNKQNIRLVHIFENKKQIVKSRLKNILGLTTNKIYARVCVVKHISTVVCRQFLNENHIQGYINSTYRYGLYYNGELVSVMTFNSNGQYFTLLRFCNKLDTVVVGGAGKLLKYFIRELQPKQIITSCDRRWLQGQLYQILGFEFDHYTQPNYFYIVNGRRTKKLTETQVAKLNASNKIYDCGESIFVMNL